MGKFSIVMPKLGESIIEATITRWLKNVGDSVTEDDALVEIATDKVDSEIPSPVEGVLSERFFKEGDVVAVGTVIATIETDAAAAETPAAAPAAAAPVPVPETAVKAQETAVASPETITSASGKFYSPLVKSIAKQEKISAAELDGISGSGKDGRVTKQDVMGFLENRKGGAPRSPEAPKQQPLTFTGNEMVIEMDRIRQLIASHMVRSVQTSAHVTSFMEADVTKIVQWREKHKDAVLKRENQKLTFTPVFLQAIAAAVKEFPMVNVSVDGTRIIIHKNINIGMAVALPDFNLIVPVIKNADEKSLLGIVKNVNDIAERARKNKLVPDEISGGTISLTNLGSFGTLMGTPIINQPQTAIIAVGSIKKRPVVIETPEGDSIAIRQMMFVSISYDHRVIDGALAGRFLNRLVQLLENFNPDQLI